MKASPAKIDSLKSAPLSESERLQSEHYDTIAADYEAHYSDEASREYRRRFIHEPMFAGINLEGKSVLDAMCGSGQTTEFLLDRNANVTGLDISQEIVSEFQLRWPNAQVVQRSLLDSQLASESFDCISIVGGLHHIHPYVDEAMTEIHRLLKPGGFFCFMEPHVGSFPDLVRRLWYKHDRYFSENEAAIDLATLETDFADRFIFRRTMYQGNIAFLLVLNSLIFRVPLSWKRVYAKPLLALEGPISLLQGKWNSCFVVAQWQKTQN